jgi:hypothetical protein
MRHEPLAGSPGEWLEGAATAPRSKSVLPHPPPAFDRREVGATRGGEAMEAQRIAGVVAGCVKRGRPVPPTARDAHDARCIDGGDRRHALLPIWASRLGLPVGHDGRAAWRGALVACPQATPPHAAGAPAPGALVCPRGAWAGRLAFALTLTPRAGGEAGFQV